MNSRGSVIPVRNEQNATENSAPPTWLRFSAGAARYIASAAPGRPNIITGKKPFMNTPAPYRHRRNGVGHQT